MAKNILIQIQEDIQYELTNLRQIQKKKEL